MRQGIIDVPGCFYTGLRHVFAEIDGLGKLYKGEYGKAHTAWNAVHFGKDYLGRVNAKYEQVFGLIFDMYRHGLAHGHVVRTARFLKSRKWYFVYWGLTEERADHLALKKDATGRRVWLVVSVPQLIDDTIAAIDYFVADLEEKGATSRLFARFKRGYAGTCVSLREPPGKKGTKKLALNQYSQEGIDWLRLEA